MTLILLLPAVIGAGIIYLLLGELQERQERVSRDQVRDWQTPQTEWLHSRF